MLPRVTPSDDAPDRSTALKWARLFAVGIPIILWLVVAVVLSLCVQRYYDGRAPQLAHSPESVSRWILLAFNWLWFGVAALCLAAALWFLLDGDTQAAGELASKFRASPLLKRILSIVAIAIPILLLMLSKLAFYWNFQLTADSGPAIQGAWNFLHGYGFANSCVGQSILADHFRLFMPLMSLALLVWNSGASIPAVHGIALGLTIVAVYLVSRRHTEDAVTPVLVALMAAAHPLFLNLIITPLDDCVLAPCFFLWAVYFWESERRWPAAILAILILTLKEEAPFLWFGIGLYLVATLRGRQRVWGAAVSLASILLWKGEMAIIEAARRSEMSSACQAFNGWGLYSRLGPSGSAVMSLVAHRPWRVLAVALTPLQAWSWPALDLAALAFLPLGAGWSSLPMLAAWLPHQMADYFNSFHIMDGWYAGFVVGPLFWSAAVGSRHLKRIPARWMPAARAGMLAIAGFCFLMFPGRYLLDWKPPSWLASMPKIMQQVPPNAKVWCDEALLPQFATRRYVRQLPSTLPSCFFQTDLFMPDRVIFSATWAGKSDASASRSILNLLHREGFQMTYRDEDLMVLSNPHREDLGAPMRRIEFRPPNTGSSAAEPARSSR